MRNKSIFILVLAMTLALLGQETAFAFSSYVTSFQTQYLGTYQTAHPGQSLTIDGCVLCHINPAGGGTRTSYGNAFAGTHDYVAIEGLDSDNDGFSNLVEIMALPETYPGDATSHPVAVTTTTTAAATTTTTAAATTTTTAAATTTTTTTIPPNPGSDSITLSMIQGWNLLSSTIGFQLSTVFGDGAKFTSVWAWGGGNWLVYVSGEAIPGAYAASKGFATLAAITSGQGFWVDSKMAQQVTVTGTLDYGALTFTQGWNLLGLKSDQASSAAALASLNSGITSIWAWSNNNWLVAIPGESNPGAYAASHNFGVLTAIYPGEGFWVNIHPNQGGSTTVDAATALTTTCLGCHGNNQSKVSCANSKWTAHKGSKVDAATFDAVSIHLTGGTCVDTTVDAATALTTTCLGCHGNNQSKVNCANSEWMAHKGSKVDGATFDAVSISLTGGSCTGQGGSSDLDGDQ